LFVNRRSFVRSVAKFLNLSNVSFIVAFAIILVIKMKEIILLGRGGQGAVTSSRVLAIAAFNDGNYSQAFPNFGVERMGAPVRSYCRIDKEFINLRQQVYDAEYAIILDATLLSGLHEKVKDTIIINSNKKSSEIKLDTKAKIKCVDITKIALEVIGKPFVNIAALGAFAGITGEISLKGLEEAVKQQMGNKGAIVEKNIEAIKKVYEEAKK
jgi:pyruvate ferredoxin oxidoreductase gamma subunit